MKKIRVGIVGSKFAAELHVNAYEQNKEYYEIVGVCSRHRKNAEIFAKKHKIKRVYENVNEMVSSKEIDVVDICSATNSHEEIILKAIDYGKNIICEKPLLGYFGDGSVDKELMLEDVKKKVERIERKMKESSVKFLYAENLLFSPVLTKIKRMLEASNFGILDIRSEVSHSGSQAEYAKRWMSSGGGSLLRNGSHAIAVALHLKAIEGKYLYGRPIKIENVFANTGFLTKTETFKKTKKDNYIKNVYDVEDWSTVILEFEDGTKAVVFSNDVSLGGVRNHIQVTTSKSVIYGNITPNNTLISYTPNGEIWDKEFISEKLETKSGWNFPAPDDIWIRGFSQEFKEFARSLSDDKEFYSDFQFAKKIILTIYSAYVSAQNGEKVKVKV